MPRTNTAGVSNAGPIEEATVLRADGSRVEVHVPCPDPIEPDPEPEAKPAKTTGRGRSGGK
jgi:hypothetical protein